MGQTQPRPVKVLFICPYPPGIAPSQRFRFEHFLPILKDKHIAYDVAPFLSAETMEILYRQGHYFSKLFGVLGGFMRRFILMFRLGQYTKVYIHREASHIGPPVFEWIIARVCRKKIIYDFDDAIWLPNFSEHNKWMNRLKGYGKVKSICKWSDTISCGNHYLAEFARQYNSNAVFFPTIVNTDLTLHKQQNHHTSRPCIGWTGSYTTVGYLDFLQDVIQRLEAEFDFDFVVISNRPPDIKCKSLVFVPWNKDTEAEDLLRFHIGIMPLDDTPWSQGKCAFKAIQYMAQGIPALVSPVGANLDVVDHGTNGYYCKAKDEWYHYLKKLLTDAPLREQLGTAARSKIEEVYSVKATTPLFVELIS